MKKKLLLLLCALFYTNVYAYSDRIIPGGNSIGININTNGVIITGFYKVNGKVVTHSPKLLIGDVITGVNGTDIHKISDLMEEIKNNIYDNKINLNIKRGDKTFSSVLTLINEDDNFKTGLYVKDEINGVGTLSYIDPNTKIYGALGHEIRETNSSKKIEIDSGTIFEGKVTNIDKSSRGNPGAKNATFNKQIVYGDIKKNELTGIYGNYNVIPKKEAKEVASLDDVTLGDAKILTVTKGLDVLEYNIKINKIDKNNPNKNIYFEVTDKKLLDLCGGIVQGMSGSPIVQNDKIIGVVSHVVVDNPKNGYAISIIKMLEDGDKLNK